MADINKLRDKIKSTIYPNGKGAINASDHQAMLLDMADGMAETDTKLTELEDKTKDIYPYNNDKQFIVADSKGNIVAIIDEEGVHSLDYFNKEGNSLTESIEIISFNLIKNIQEVKDYVDSNVDEINRTINESTIKDIYKDLNKDEFVLSDSKGNVIAKVDSEGVHSVDFIDEENNSVIGQIADITERIKDLYTDKEDALFIADSNLKVIAIIDKKGVHSVGFETPEIKTIDNGSDGIEIADADGNVILKLNNKFGISDIVGDFYKKNYAVAQTCWIDDDFAVYYNGELRPQYQLVHDWCIENDVRLDFAFIPNSYSDGSDDRQRLTLREQWEDENFRFLLHPIHDGWYNYSNNNVHDIEKVKAGIVKCIRFFKQQNFLTNCDILVYPGSSNKFADNVDVLRNYIDCGITATDNETNHLVDNARMQINRYAVNFSQTKTKSIVKRELKEYIDRGDWVILYTHMYNYTDENIIDETTNSVANVLDVVGYVNSLCKLRPTEAIWRERKNLYNFYKK